MTEQEILTKLTVLFRDVFDRPGLELSGATTADDVDGWDSLMNVRLFVATEMEFGTRFDTAEINSLRNVGDLVRLVHAKL